MRRALSLVLGNFSAGPETRRFPERVAPEGRFRGAVHINTDRCICCGLCDYMCVSGAIEIVDRQGAIQWSYDIGKCTLCSSCVSHCPVGALKQDADRSQPYDQPAEVLVSLMVPFPVCKECGTPVPPARGEAFRELLELGPAQIRERAQTCASCASKKPSAPAEKKGRTRKEDADER